MIHSIEVLGFKRFKGQRFDVAPLTLLTGLNGSGKTSLIHALLLACEASTTASDTVRLNGPFGMELGTAEDIRNWSSGDSIEVTLRTQSSGEAAWRFGMPTNQALYLTVEKKPDAPPVAFSSQARALTYLCAERLGPRSVLAASPLPSSELEVGVRGEHCAQIIAAIGNKPLQYEERVHPECGEPSSTLLKYEVEGWLSEIARPVELDTVPFPGATITALRFRSPGGDWVRAPNMGFGVSYALPIILAGLIARRGGLLIVENPEAHLHPAGQSRMGVFLAWLAGRGVQVFVETHSDHILNGIRRAIGEHEYLEHDKAIAHFFESDSDDAPTVHPLSFTAIGGVSHWPQGFFDQYQIDVASLGRIRRRR